MPSMLDRLMTTRPARGVKRRARSYVDEPMRRVELRAALLRPWWRYRFQAFGDTTILHKPSWLYGAHKIAIGEGTVIFMSWLAVERRAWGQPGPVLSIGRRVAMRPYSTISAAESIVIEDDVGIASHSLVIDSDHMPLEQGTWTDEGAIELSEQAVGNPIVYSPLATSPVRIGRGTWLGERVAVLRGSDIGQHCIIGTNSVVQGQIPDFSVAVGAPARVVGSTRRSSS
jgi:lipopolysaccharide O-acetyltransferase